MSYTHTHLHTQYSLLDGAILIPELMRHLKENDMEACAITDHGTMSGVVDFYKQCKENNIKPLLGSEVYVTNDRDNIYHKNRTKDNHHMIIIAKNNKGYSKMLNITSIAALDNFYYKPRVYKEHLRALGGDVVVTSACLGGIFSQLLEYEKDENNHVIDCTDPYGRAADELNFYLSIFKDDFYLELQVWDDPTGCQQIYNNWLLEFGNKHGVPFVIAADCHYVKQEDYKLHELLMAMQFQTTVEKYKQKSKMQYGPHFYVASPKEMLRRAQSLQCTEAYDNTRQIATICNVELQLGIYEEPYFDITQTSDYREFLAWKKNRH